MRKDTGSAMLAKAGLILAVTFALFCIVGCTKPKAMDVRWSQDLVDDNALARNPVWFETTQVPGPPNICAFCPCGNQDPQAWQSAANCTNQTLDTNSSFECFGHWNWFPVEYDQATVIWGGHSNSVFDDDDYYFGVHRPDKALETAATDELHVEFDSEETVDYWDDTHTWWDDFHHNAVDNNDATAHTYIDNKDVIVVGLLGIDSQHGNKSGLSSELNPAYAMFVHVQNDATQDKWAFFVKNWGNEGYCGDNEQSLDPIRSNTLKIRIRHPGKTTFGLTQNVWVYGDDSDEFNKQSWNYQETNDGVLLTFQLRNADTHSGFVGDLTFNWGGGIILQSTGASAANSKDRASNEQSRVRAESQYEADGDMAVKSKFNKLDAANQALLRRQLAQLNHHPKAQASRGTANTTSMEAPAKPDAAFPKYKMVKSVPNPTRRDKRTLQRKLVLAFLKEHGIE